MNLVYHSRPFRRLSRISISKAVKKSNTCMQKEIIYKINSVFNSESTYIPNLVFRQAYMPHLDQKKYFTPLSLPKQNQDCSRLLFFFSVKSF